MAMKKKESQETQIQLQIDDIDDISKQLIKDLNKEFGMKVAYNLNEQDAPTIVKRWINTGSIQLNYIIGNISNAGYPEGRIIEVSGMPSCGKSHLAYHAAANVQKKGGLVIYIDTENATPVQKLQGMGIDVKKHFVYVDEHCTESVFKVIESTINKAKQISTVKDVPIFVIWDSIAATSPKAELEGDYDQNTVGLQARTLSKGFRKITGIIGQNNVTLLCLNQLRDAVGQMYGDTQVTPGGKALPFHSSVRIRLSSGSPVKDKDGNIIGIHVIATIKKNKVAPPFRKCEFDIIFGKGIIEHEYIFDELRQYCADETKQPVIVDGLKVVIEGTGAWKNFKCIDVKTGEIVKEKKFYKAEFDTIIKEYEKYIKPLISAVYTISYDENTNLNLNEDEINNEVFDIDDNI